MGDPFSVAGTAIGITPLGIQTCQILHRYYSQTKGSHDDIDNMLRHVEGLQGILDCLRQVKDKIEIDNHARKRLLWPFGKDTLADLQTTLNMFQDNLTLVLQCAGLDNVIRQFGGVQSTLNIWQSHSTSIEQHVVEHTSALTSMHQDVTDGRAFQQQNYNTMVALRTELFDYNMAVKDKLDALVLYTGGSALPADANLNTS